MIDNHGLLVIKELRQALLRRWRNLSSLCFVFSVYTSYSSLEILKEYRYVIADGISAYDSRTCIGTCIPRLLSPSVLILIKPHAQGTDIG